MWLNLKNITTEKPYKKLDWKNGKYTVLEVISNYSYKLDTPPEIHNVFHISLLKRAADNLFLNQRQGNFWPPIIIVDRKEEWEVKRVLRKCIRSC